MKECFPSVANLTEETSLERGRWAVQRDDSRIFLPSGADSPDNGSRFPPVRLPAFVPLRPGAAGIARIHARSEQIGIPRGITAFPLCSLSSFRAYFASFLVRLVATPASRGYRLKLGPREGQRGVTAVGETNSTSRRLTATSINGVLSFYDSVSPYFNLDYCPMSRLRLPLLLGLLELASFELMFRSYWVLRGQGIFGKLFLSFYYETGRGIVINEVVLKIIFSKSIE